jgi:hypothetical protein
MDIINARFLVIGFALLVLGSMCIDWRKPVRALNLLVVGATTNLYLLVCLVILQDGGDVWIALKAMELAMAALFGWCFGTIYGAVRMYRDSRRQAAVEAKDADQWGLPWDGYTDDDGAYLDAICGDANPYENMMDRELDVLLDRLIEQARVISAHSGDMFALPVQVEIDAIYAEMRRRG